MVEPKVVAAYRGQVVGLAGVGLGVVPGQLDALPLQVVDAAVDGDFCIVLGAVGQCGLIGKGLLNANEESK